MAKEYKWNNQQGQATAFQNQFDSWFADVQERGFYKTYSTETLQERIANDPIFAQFLQIEQTLREFKAEFTNAP